MRDDAPVVGVPWETFQRWWGDVWEPGQHVALIGPTGTGKSTFAVGILRGRKYVAVFDTKGGDSTLAKAGFERVSTWPPPRDVREAIADGKPAHLLVGGLVKTSEDREKLLEVQRKALREIFTEGGWTVYADELQLLADRRMGKMGSEIETLLVAARDKAISVVSSYQAPAWVPTAASRQATWVVVWPTRDEDVIRKLGAIMGRPKAELQAALHELDDHMVLIVGRNPRAPLVLTKAPRV